MILYYYSQVFFSLIPRSKIAFRRTEHLKTLPGCGVAWRHTNSRKTVWVIQCEWPTVRAIAIRGEVENKRCGYNRNAAHFWKLAASWCVSKCKPDILPRKPGVIAYAGGQIVCMMTVMNIFCICFNCFWLKSFWLLYVDYNTPRIPCIPTREYTVSCRLSFLQQKWKLCYIMQ